MTSDLTTAITSAAQAVEIAGVAVLLLGALLSSAAFAARMARGSGFEPAYRGLRADLARAILHLARTMLYAIAVLVCATPAPAPAAELLYTTVTGDTLWDLCEQFVGTTGCAAELQRFNAIGNDRRVPVGAEVRIPAQWLRDARIVGGTLEASGSAEYRSIGAKDFAALVVDEPVYLGDTIRTGAGTAVLEFVSGLMIQLRPDSVLQLESFSDDVESPVVNLALERGGMEAAVLETEAKQAAGESGDYSVQTPAAVAGIAGAARLNAGEGGATMRGESLRGELELAAGSGGISVPEGYGAGVKSGEQPDAPRALLPAASLPGAEGAGAPSHTWTVLPADEGSARAIYQQLFVQTPYEGATGAKSRGEETGSSFVAALQLLTGKEAALARFANSFAPLELSWTDLPGARSWMLDLRAGPHGAPLIRSYRSDGPALVLPDIAPGCYVIALRGVDADGFEGLESRQLVCVHPPLSAPAAPSVTAPGNESLRLEWPAVEHAVRYELDIAEDPEFTRILRTVETGSTNLEIAAGASGESYARVRALNVAGLKGPAGEGSPLQACAKPPAKLLIGVMGVLVLLL